MPLVSKIGGQLQKSNPDLCFSSELRREFLPQNQDLFQNELQNPFLKQSLKGHLAGCLRRHKLLITWPLTDGKSTQPASLPRGLRRLRHGCAARTDARRGARVSLFLRPASSS